MGGESEYAGLCKEHHKEGRDETMEEKHHLFNSLTLTFSSRLSDL